MVDCFGAWKRASLTPSKKNSDQAIRLGIRQARRGREQKDRRVKEGERKRSGSIRNNGSRYSR